MLAAVVVLLAVGLLSRAVKAQSLDYVTEEEEDLIRDAQGLPARVPLFLKLLDNRIVALGLRERSAKEREQAKKDLEDYEREVKEAKDLKVKDAEIRAKPLRPDIYLRNTPRTDLLRGYIQIIQETMDNIDDAYIRKLDVRRHVESLEKFISEQLPRFDKFEARTPAETAALKDAIDHSKEAIEDCRKALKSLPKTESIEKSQKNSR